MWSGFTDSGILICSDLFISSATPASRWQVAHLKIADPYLEWCLYVPQRWGIWLRYFGRCPWTMLISCQSVQVSPYKFRKILQDLRVRHPLYIPMDGTWPCMLPATDQEFLYELKQMIDKVQDVEEKSPLLIFHKHCHESAAHDCVLQGYICRRGQVEQSVGLCTRVLFQQIPCPYLGLFMAPLGGLWPSIPFPQRVDFVLKTSFSRELS